MDLKNELAAVSWRRSSYTGPNGGNCVEVAPLSGARVAVRDSKQYGQGPVLIFDSQQWSALIGGISRGELGLQHQAAIWLERGPRHPRLSLPYVAPRAAGRRQDSGQATTIMATRCPRH